ncbi:hypothetical protein ACR52_20925 [Pseudomonas fildesensis]|uniref:Uncharacterized protein n=1 Tax=Pseudomonas fildesensis TaxID=1674920 RepID=A0A0J8IQ68_9PSED|nr:hypothetical protein ACR52_20925 [Pseudomonas fildesensis]
MQLTESQYTHDSMAADGEGNAGVFAPASIPSISATYVASTYKFCRPRPLGSSFDISPLY